MSANGTSQTGTLESRIAIKNRELEDARYEVNSAIAEGRTQAVTRFSTQVTQIKGEIAKLEQEKKTAASTNGGSTAGEVSYDGHLAEPN
jgi:hypothetical protein